MKIVKLSIIQTSVVSTCLRWIFYFVSAEAGRSVPVCCVMRSLNIQEMQSLFNIEILQI